MRARPIKQNLALASSHDQPRWGDAVLGDLRNEGFDRLLCSFNPAIIIGRILRQGLVEELDSMDMGLKLACLHVVEKVFLFGSNSRSSGLEFLTGKRQLG